MMKKKIDCVTVGDLETNCWLYAVGDGEELPVAPDLAGPEFCAVIDPGDDAALIVSRLRELNWVPVYIFLTHGHFDHVAALPDLLEAFAKGVFGEAPLPKIGIHRLDAHYLGKDALGVHRKSFSAAGGNPAYVDALWKPLPEADILFEEGAGAGPFTVLHLPGHSPGSAGFYDEKTGVLFSGDTLFRGTWGRTDLPGGDEEALRGSLNRLLAMPGPPAGPRSGESSPPDEIVVCPGHGMSTTIGEER